MASTGFGDCMFSPAVRIHDKSDKGDSPIQFGTPIALPVTVAS
jgi:hypothetical protein